MRMPAAIAAALLVLPLSARAEDSWVGADKALHLGLSAAIASAGYGVASLELDRPGRFLVGGGVALGAGVAKELWDLSGHGDPSWKDLTADLVGTAVGLALAFAVDALLAQPAPRQVN
jgi:putative lipoprotein